MVDMVPDWAQAVPNAPIHTAPPKVGGGWSAPMPWQQLVATCEFFLTSFIGQVAIALGGIEILGWRPLQFLSDWGHDLVDKASDAYIRAVSAQGAADAATGIGNDAQYSADTANAGVALLNAKAAGTGTVFTDTFNRAPSTNLGPDYDRSMGSGSGTFGPDGDGDAVWTVGGSTSQTCMDRITAALTTTTQAMAVVLANPPRAGVGSSNSGTILCLRTNSAKTTYVQATIGAGAVDIGYVNAGSFTRIGATVVVTMKPGDLWEFRAGAIDPATLIYDDYRLELLRNGRAVCTRVDTGHASQAGSSAATWVGTYDYGMLIERAGDAGINQLNAPTVRVLTVADRTP